MTHPNIVYLKDYQKSRYSIDQVDLTFSLFEEHTFVKNRMQFRLNPESDSQNQELRLDGQALKLLSLTLDGKTLEATKYQVLPDCLLIADLPAQFVLEIHTESDPQNNKSLEGLYKSGGIFCTQCEAQGFRRITYFLDRPDIMTTYRVTIDAEKAKYPFLLSNGNCISRTELPDGRHQVSWHDPHKKPSYLFALVAGDLAISRDTFTTRSGRKVNLEIYVNHGNQDKTQHAMESLKRAMKWDEEVFGLEYDLDIFMIVAVDDFNGGAMENKGLNIFNSKYVLAKPETATDVDYELIEAIIGHEYFHNWTGNRVTCRDWFQLSLKEGLTVFRDQEFSSDMGSRAVKRIDSVNRLRTEQFSEDSGPMAHPVRPQSYIAMDNFYTRTVYEKGAEVIRMIHTLIGKENFHKGMDKYFQLFDGKAVTTDDFVHAMELASGQDLAQFKLWYDQAGTPTLDVKTEYDPKSQKYLLHVTQTCPEVLGLPKPKPFHIPLMVGLLDSNGKSIPLDGEKTSRLCQIRKENETFIFEGISAKPVPSLLRGFSAPVRVNFEYTNEELIFLFANDTDAVARWDAGQELFLRTIRKLMTDLAANRPIVVNEGIFSAIRQVLLDKDIDDGFKARLLNVPTESYIAQFEPNLDPHLLFEARETFLTILASNLEDDVRKAFEYLQNSEISDSRRLAGTRALKGILLDFLVQTGKIDWTETAFDLYKAAKNMTDSMIALGALNGSSSGRREEALAHFRTRWCDEYLVMTKWMKIQATSKLPNTLQTLLSIEQANWFNGENPNNIYSLHGTFGSHNMARFHSKTGEGYKFLSDKILDLDKKNPQVAARLCGVFNQWKKFAAPHQELMKKEVERIHSTSNLSNNVFEIVDRALKQ